MTAPRGDGARTVRLAKAALVAMAAAFALLAGIDNVLDPGANLPFVEHVLRMDTTFRDPAMMGRAIVSPFVHHLAFQAIVAAELASGASMAVGAVLMIRGRASTARFAGGKRCALVGLILAIALWFGGFLVIAGEWFAMWQSARYNAQQAAFQYAVILLLIVAILVPAEPDQTRDARSS